MLTDFLLASLHHLLVFALVAMLVAEAVLLRGPLDGAGVRRIARLDGGYGLAAVLLLAAGGLRIVWGIKGWDFYLHNPWFHAKLGLFLVVGLLSIHPTLRLLRWRKALKADMAFIPPAVEQARARIIVRIELVLVAAIFVLAAAMARHGGL